MLHVCVHTCRCCPDFGESVNSKSEFWWINQSGAENVDSRVNGDTLDSCPSLPCFWSCPVYSRRVVVFGWIFVEFCFLFYVIFCCLFSLFCCVFIRCLYFSWWYWWIVPGNDGHFMGMMWCVLSSIFLICNFTCFFRSSILSHFFEPSFFLINTHTHTHTHIFLFYSSLFSLFYGSLILFAFLLAFLFFFFLISFPVVSFFFKIN